MKIRLSIVLLLLVIALTGCGKRDQHFQGYVEGEDIYLTSPFSGLVVNKSVSRGAHVKKGQLLFKLDPNPQIIEINQSYSLLKQAEKTLLDLKRPRRPPEIAAIKAQILQADARLDLAAIRVKRNQILYEKHVLDKDSFDASVEHLKEAQQIKAQFVANLDLALEGARVDQIEAQQFQVNALRDKLNEAQWQLVQKSVHAPDDGIIVDTYFNLGEFVPLQRPLAALLTPKNTRIEFFVPVEALASLHISTPVRFLCDGCRVWRPAVVTYVSPDAEYVPPLVYSRENNNKLVFRVRANTLKSHILMPGQPVIVAVSGAHHAA